MSPACAEGDAVVALEGVSKTFHYRPYPRGTMTLKGALLDALLLRRPALVSVRALQGVSLRVRPGEAVALVGRNGAGKTTLLRLLGGAYRPDSGRVAVRGRTALLAELGAGFHPDLSGLENAELAALAAGLDRREVTARLDAILAFSGLGERVNAPLRTYSSGMVLRLGFSVAAGVEPAVLLVDEALAVGDLEFQARCLERVAALRRAGAAVVLASHDLGTVEAVCDRALLLERGAVLAEGPAPEVCQAYRALGPG